MYSNGFAVRIFPGTEERDGYHVLKHGQEYSIRLTNDRYVRCDAEIKIDGKEIGAFRINSRSKIEIERPADEAKKFVFYKASSQQAQKCDVRDIEKSERGLITVHFKPEKIAYKPYGPYTWGPYTGGTGDRRRGDYCPETIAWNYSWTDNTSSSSDCYYSSSDELSESTSEYDSKSIFRGITKNQYESGITGLKGDSNQRFVVVDNLNYDLEDDMVIHIRLVAPSKDREDPKPLRGLLRSTKIPPPILIL